MNGQIVDSPSLNAQQNGKIDSGEARFNAGLDMGSAEKKE